MNVLNHIIRFELMSLWRDQTLKLLLVIFLAAGVYGIYFGKFEIEKQEARIAVVQGLERNQFDSLVAWVGLDTTIHANKKNFERAISPTGVGRERHFTYYVTHDTPPLAGLCLGQRDLFPVYYGINITDLARQVNVGELANPMKLLTGNFDLSYVFVFLLPLLLISLFYNLYASEKEGGTLSLLQAQPVSLTTIFLGKGILRLLIVWGVSGLLLLIGFVLQGISLTENINLFSRWLSVIFGYSLLWTILMSGIVALRRGNSLSAMMGLGLWLVFTLITPALLNLLVNIKEPVPNRAEVIHATRTLNDQIWETPRSFVMDRFNENNPEFGLIDTSDFNKWYYAGLTLLDEEVKSRNADIEKQVTRRQEWLSRWDWLAPAGVVHEYLSELSETDRDSHLRFITFLHEYHNDLKTIYYEKIFSSQTFNRDDLAALQSKIGD